MSMAPEQFVMWLRGAMDASSLDKGIEPEVAHKIYEQLSAVVAGLVAKKFSYEDDIYRQMTKQPGQAGQAVPIGFPYPTYAGSSVGSGTITGNEILIGGLGHYGDTTNTFADTPDAVSK